jgi:hypothetical protein
MRKATIANIETLKMFDNDSIIINDNDNDINKGISYKGWIFKSIHGPILDSNQRDNIAIDIANEYNNYMTNKFNNDDIKANANDDKIILNDSILRLPSALFDDHITINKLSSNFMINFNAKDALVCWVHQHSNDSIEILQVPYATTWKEKQNYGKLQESGSSNEFICNEMRKWDWTFSTEYECTCEHEYDSDNNLLNLFKFSSSQDIRNKDIKYAINVKEFSSNTISTSENRRKGWFQTDKSGIDITMLSQTNVPILFYDEIILYQDDLDDCGESTLEIKIRVMPECWFVLKRLFIRVDDVKVRIRDCRLFHKFGDSSIHMEVTWKEASLPLPQHIQTVLVKSALQLSGLPMHLNSQSMPPSMLLKSGTLAQHLPNVMEHEKLHSFYSMII